MKLMYEAGASSPKIDSEGLRLIAEERRRQIEVEGWTAKHDDGHHLGELARAAAVYAIPEDLHIAGLKGFLSLVFPWAAPVWLKRTNRKRDLVKAGALIAAEIDRLTRLEEKKSANF